MIKLLSFFLVFLPTRMVNSQSGGLDKNVHIKNYSTSFIGDIQQTIILSFEKSLPLPLCTFPMLRWYFNNTALLSPSDNTGNK